MGLGGLLIIVAIVVVCVSYKICGPAAAALQLTLILTYAVGSLMNIGLHIFVRGMGYGSKIEDKIIHPEL